MSTDGGRAAQPSGERQRMEDGGRSASNGAGGTATAVPPAPAGYRPHSLVHSCGLVVAADAGAIADHDRFHDGLRRLWSQQPDRPRDPRNRG